jgi:energy-coupling factor transporter ATP-binding protein EcfA2
MTAPILRDLGTKFSSIDQPVSQLSGGNQQKVVLSKWLINQTRFLLLDEPSRGLDVGAKADLYKVIREMADDGLAVLVASSELDELYANCDAIWVFHEGRASEVFSPNKHSREEILHATIVGVVAVGMTFVILTANIDLSVGSVVAFGGMVVAVLMKSGVPPFLAGCLTVIAGAVLGLGMGAITAYAKVPSFIITLAGLVSIRGVTYLISQGTPLGGFPRSSMRSVPCGWEILRPCRLSFLESLWLRSSSFGSRSLVNTCTPPAATFRPPAFPAFRHKG